MPLDEQLLEISTGRTVVRVHQVVRDRSGQLVAETTVWHVYVIEGGGIRAMTIRK